jgi:hypothetical protein
VSQQVHVESASAGLQTTDTRVVAVAGAQEHQGPDGKPAASRWQGDWAAAARYCLLVYVCVRVALLLLGLLTVALIPAQSGVGVPGWPAPTPSAGWHNAFTAWERADALWFLKIASSGYAETDGSPAFFPLFPMLVHAVGVLTGGRWLLAGFLVSNVALLVGLVVLYRLTAETFSDRMARRTVLYLCLFPTSFFLFSPFSEPVFLAFTVGCLYAARHRSWALAGALGAGAALTRQVGITLCLVLAVEAVHQLAGDRRAGSWSVTSGLGRLLACAGPALGTGSYLAYWQWRAGDWHTPFTAQSQGWDRDVSFPPETLLRATKIGTDYLGVYPGGYFTVDLLLVVVALLAAVWVALRTRPLFGAYAWVSLVFPLVFVFDGRPLMAAPRYLLVIFPLFWALARFGERWRAHDLVVGLSAAGLALLGALAVSWFPIF